MNKIIFKYDLRHNDRTLLVLPMGAKPLYVDQQNGNIKIWIEQDKEPDLGEGIRSRAFLAVPTGEVFDLSGVHRYMGTVPRVKGSLVCHIYEVDHE